MGQGIHQAFVEIDQRRRSKRHDGNDDDDQIPHQRAVQMGETCPQRDGLARGVHRLGVVLNTGEKFKESAINPATVWLVLQPWRRAWS